jgi:hypothetical protein
MWVPEINYYQGRKLALCREGQQHLVGVPFPALALLDVFLLVLFLVDAAAPRGAYVR